MQSHTVTLSNCHVVRFINRSKIIFLKNVPQPNRNIHIGIATSFSSIARKNSQVFVILLRPWSSLHFSSLFHKSECCELHNSKPGHLTSSIIFTMSQLDYKPVTDYPGQETQSFILSSQSIWQSSAPRELREGSYFSISALGSLIIETL